MKIRRTAALILSLLLLLSAGAMLYFRRAFRPAVLSMAENFARTEMTVAINSAVAEEYAAENSAFTELVTVEYGDGRAVSAIHTDAGRVNALKAKLSVAISDALSKTRGKTFKIPLGNALNSDFLSGKGPDVNVKIISVGAVTTDFETEFTSCAINQTHYKLVLKVSADLTIYVPFSQASTHVATGVCISDTVIVGDVPDAYTYVDEGGTGLAGTLNDYGATVS